MLYRRIRDLREDKDLTQQQVGALLGVSQRTYSYYENGRHVIPPEMLVKLADFYGVTLDYLLERSDEK